MKADENPCSEGVDTPPEDENLCQAAAMIGQINHAAMALERKEAEDREQIRLITQAAAMISQLNQTAVEYRFDKLWTLQSYPSSGEMFIDNGNYKSCQTKDLSILVQMLEDQVKMVNYITWQFKRKPWWRRLFKKW